jgi:hypothetical protein
VEKQIILDEIKRVARENGGRALGKARFFKETGIKESDIDRYWVRWSEAVRQAGCEPNTLQARHDDVILAERLISLIRELGHFPVRNKLRLKVRNDPSFPNSKTFARFAGGTRPKTGGQGQSLL